MAIEDGTPGGGLKISSLFPMSLCSRCGNLIVVDSCVPDTEYWTPVCLACQHTGRHEQSATAKLMAANLKAIYAALESKEQSDAEAIVLEKVER